MSNRDKLLQEQVFLIQKNINRILKKATTDEDAEFIIEQFDLTIKNCNNLTFKYQKNKDFDYIKQFTNECKKTLNELNYYINHKIKLPKRSNMKYLRIERYEDYEYAHCIAYEMAIRNEEVIKLTKLLEKLNILVNYALHCMDINKLKENITKYFKISANKPSIKEIEAFRMSLISENLNEIHIASITASFDNIINKYSNEYLCNIISKYCSESFIIYTEKYAESILKNLFDKASNSDKNILINLLLISVQTKLEKEYYVVNEQKSIKPKDIEIFISKDTNHEPNPAINEHISTTFNDSDYMDNYINEKGYTSYQGKYKDDNSFNINKVLPNFEQPLRMFNTMEISINPSLPLNDILSFVKKIKEDYDKKNSFKSFFELIEEELNFPSDTTKSTITNTSSFSKNKWADMFYIYDYFQYYFSDGHEINKGKTENERENKEDDGTTIAKEISLQLSYYHILNYKNSLNFSTLCDDSNYKSPYSKYETDLLFEIKEKIEENKEYEEYIKLKKTKDGDTEETINLYMTANHIKTDYYPKMKKLIEGENPEYKKLIGGRNHEKNSFIDGKNNVSSKL